jgi:hypothetical protein
MSLKRTRDPSPELQDIEDGIFRSGVIEDNGSKFIGVFSASLPIKTLQRLPDFKDFHHRIVGWRKPSRQKSIIPNAPPIMHMGHDDDGERWAGKRLEKVLEDEDVGGTVVVGRWWGGNNLGPVRFTHIETVAKQAVRKWLEAAEEHKQAEGRKKQRLDEENALQELRECLRQRDESIVTLRGLLADKTAWLKETDRAPPTPSRKPPDYDIMGKEALERVEKARDATLSYIFKELDKVDEQLKQAGKSTKPPESNAMDSIPEEGQADTMRTRSSELYDHPDDGTRLRPLQLPGTPNDIHQATETHLAQPETLNPGPSNLLSPPNETRLTTESPSIQTLSFSEITTFVNTPGSSVTSTSQSDPAKQTAD